MALHNGIRDGVAYQDGKVFTPMHVRDNPLVFAGRSVEIPKAQPAGTTTSPSKNQNKMLQVA